VSDIAVTVTNPGSAAVTIGAGGSVSATVSSGGAVEVNLGGSWESITGKPTEFTPAAHTHEISDISGLESALGIGEDDAVDGGFYFGVVPNTIAITSQPTSQAANNGAATFSVAATVDPEGTPSYQWQKQDGGLGLFVNVNGATTNTLSLSGLTNAADNGDVYRVIVSATDAASVTSVAATLIVGAPPTITITTQPTNQTSSGGAASFSVAATVSPSGTPSYQWQRSNDAGTSWANVAGATSATLSLTGLTVEADGNARFRAIVSAASAASVTSNAATLTVGSFYSLAITQQPTNQTAAGGAAAFSVMATVTPSGTPSYQWQKSDRTGSNGSTWTQRTLPSGVWRDVEYANGVFVAIGYGINSAATSPDGITWTQRGMPASLSWESVAYGNGTFVAVPYTGGTSATSGDGATWTQRAMLGADWRSVAYGGGTFAAVASSGGIAATSADGITWTQRAMPTNAAWWAITYGDGKFVAVAQGSTQAATSADGITWTQRTIPLATWTNVAYGGGLFVAISSGSNIAATSSDGITWTQRTMPGAHPWQGLAYGNGVFVAVSENANTNVAATSADGITWTQRTMPRNATWRCVAYGNDTFVSVAWASPYAATSGPTQGAFSNISGATSSTLSLAGLTSSNNKDQYRAIASATNAAPVTSNAATLTVN
jgi:hypothetical protein